MKERNQSLPAGVSRTVRGLCEDYDRRALEIERGRLPPEVLGHYMILNATIDAALATCCEEEIRNEIRYDIGARVGHRFTQIYYLSQGTYRARKLESTLAIAKAMKLI